MAGIKRSGRYPYMSKEHATKLEIRWYANLIDQIRRASSEIDGIEAYARVIDLSEENELLVSSTIESIREGLEAMEIEMYYARSIAEAQEKAQT